MSIDKKMLRIAASVAIKNSGHRHDIRAFFLGSVGLRNDGVLVSARNIAARDIVLSHHAEARLARKLTPHSEVWVARIRSNGAWAMSRPCVSCQNRLRMVGVSRVVYTIENGEWGVMDLKDEIEKD